MRYANRDFFINFLFFTFLFINFSVFFAFFQFFSDFFRQFFGRIQIAFNHQFAFRLRFSRCPDVFNRDSDRIVGTIGRDKPLY